MLFQKIDFQAVSKQINHLTKNKKNRNKDLVNKSLKKLKKAASTNINLMPLIIDAVKSNASIGEISDTLRQVFDEYKG